MNSDLYNNTAVLPDTLLKHLGDSFNSVQLQADTNIEGFNRNQELRQSKNATYQQIKRIKSWFDGYNGNKEDAPFILNGGDRMKNWCDEVLKVWRANVDGGKKIKSDTGMQNQYIDNHEKNSFNLNDKHSSTVDDLSVNEELKKINKLMKKII
jgi:hypothetical protein